MICGADLSGNDARTLPGNSLCDGFLQLEETHKRREVCRPPRNACHEIRQSNGFPQVSLCLVENNTDFAVIVDPANDRSRLLSDLLRKFRGFEIVPEDELKLGTDMSKYLRQVT